MRIVSLKHKGIFYAALSGFLFGLLGYFGTHAMQGNLSVYNMLFWRFTVCSLFIAVVVCLQVKTLPQALKPLLKPFCHGMAFYSTSSILYFIASQYIGTGLSMVIFFTYPVIVMLLDSLLFKNQINRHYYIAMGIILAGLSFLINLQNMTLNLLGIAFGLSSAALYAFYILASKNSGGSPLVSTLMTSTGCMISCLLAAQIDGSFIIPTSFAVWGDILGIGIICTALPIICLLKGLTYISSVQASILSVLEPISVLIVAVLLLNEKIIVQQVVGAIIILAGAVFSLIWPLITGGTGLTEQTGLSSELE